MTNSLKWMETDLWRPSPLLFSVLVPWRRWMRRWCGRRSCPQWTPHRCPSSPRPPPRTARPCPPSGGVANCWAAARGAAVATADPPARLPPPLPLPLRPAGGRWRAAAPAGWTGSIPGGEKGEGSTREERASVMDVLQSAVRKKKLEGSYKWYILSFKSGSCFIHSNLPLNKKSRTVSKNCISAQKKTSEQQTGECDMTTAGICAVEMYIILNLSRQ